MAAQMQAGVDRKRLAKSSLESEDGNYENTETAIYGITEACLDILERLASELQLSSNLQQDEEPSESVLSDTSPPDITGLRNSFAFWIDYTGALAPVGASLDDRLHGHDEIKEMVIELLEMVERNLHRVSLH